MITGDESALRELLARYRGTVYATAYAAFNDPETVDAVVADTFREARQTAGEFLATKGSVSGWLTHLARLSVAARLGPSTGSSAPAVSPFRARRMSTDRAGR